MTIIPPQILICNYCFKLDKFKGKSCFLFTFGLSILPFFFLYQNLIKTTKIVEKNGAKYHIVIQHIIKMLPFGHNMFYTLEALLF